MKVLITGANGMLGHALKTVLSGEHQLICADIDEFDVTDIDNTVRWITGVGPQTVIHAAAYTDVDGCESNADQAYRINGLGARNVAVACNRLDARMVYISSDYVFDGTNVKPYKEYDSVDPLNVYGKSKLLGENLVKEMLQRHCIVRTSWLYGPNGRNFVTTMLQMGQKMKELKVVKDQIGSPTYTVDLAEGIAKLINGPYYGTYHVTNSGECSWYDLAREIFQLTGVDIKVNPTTTEEFNRPAPRPAYSVLDNHMWRLEGFQQSRSYKEALREYLGCF